ncbi:MAG: hypothetical protein Kow00104_01230 [Rhodothalassiaceae bacterium]
MTEKSELERLREGNCLLADLPDIIRIPPLGAHREEVTKPIETASLDDIAFAVRGLEAEFNAVGDRLHALRKLYTLARDAGAHGADRALDAVARGDR